MKTGWESFSVGSSLESLIWILKLVGFGVFIFESLVRKCRIRGSKVPNRLSSRSTWCADVSCKFVVERFTNFRPSESKKNSTNFQPILNSQNSKWFRLNKVSFFFFWNQPNWFQMNSILSLVAIVLAVQFVSACFITNCPPGGKRSIPDKSTDLSRKVSIRLVLIWPTLARSDSKNQFDLIRFRLANLVPIIWKVWKFILEFLTNNFHWKFFRNNNFFEFFLVPTMWSDRLWGPVLWTKHMLWREDR